MPKRTATGPAKSRAPCAATTATPDPAGAALFGVGRGLTGCCPSPALVGLGIGALEALWFVPVMLAGVAVQRWQSRR
ncbi:DUF6691 family protein [Stenotrophomonas nematodicola]|uniref:DUF6691 family protein n=1 Tax=Stenotrophomonas nematodicola TaxID=2656746 RepID=UPI003D9A16FB